MGLFFVKGSLTGPTGRKEETEFLVDTGATLLVVPRPMAERLGLAPTRSHRVMIAGRQHEVWPVAEVRLTLDGEEIPTPCFIAPAVRSLGPGRPVRRCSALWLWRAFFW